MDVPPVVVETEGTPLADSTPPPELPMPSALDQVGWPEALFLAWLAGMLIVAGLLVGQYLRMRRLLRSGSAVTDEAILDILGDAQEALGMRRGVKLLTTDRLSSPILFGLLKPRIVLPASALENLSHEQLKPIFLHELTHFRRRDLWVNWVQVALQTAYWFHPLVWLANIRLRRERELIVDDVVLSHLGGERQTYGHSLMSVLKLAARRSLLAPGYVGIVETKGGMAGRLQRILDERRKLSVRLGLLSAILLVALGFVLVPQARSDSPNGPAPEETPDAPAMTDTKWGQASKGLRCRLSTVPRHRGVGVWFKLEVENLSNADIHLPYEPLAGVTWMLSWVKVAPGCRLTATRADGVKGDTSAFDRGICGPGHPKYDPHGTNLPPLAIPKRSVWSRDFGISPHTTRKSRATYPGKYSFEFELTSPESPKYWRGSVRSNPLVVEVPPRKGRPEHEGIREGKAPVETRDEGGDEGKGDGRATPPEADANAEGRSAKAELPHVVELREEPFRGGEDIPKLPLILNMGPTHPQYDVYEHNYEAIETARKAAPKTARGQLRQRLSNTKASLSVRAVYAALLVEWQDGHGRAFFERHACDPDGEYAVIWTIGHKVSAKLPWVQELMVKVLKDRTVVTHSSRYGTAKRQVRVLGAGVGEFPARLAQVGSVASASPLRDLLRERPRGLDTRMIMKALGELGDVRAEPLLLDVLRKHRRHDYVFAAYALARIKSKKAVPVLLSHLNDRKSIYALKMYGDKAVIPDLERALPTLDPEVAAIAQLAILKLKGGDPVPQLLEHLNDRAFLQRTSVVGWLLRLKDRRAIPAMINVLAEEPDWYRRKVAIWFLRDVRTREGVDGLIANLDTEFSGLERHPKEGDIDQNQEYRNEIADALEELTGQQFRLDKEKWLTWWAQARDAWVPVETKEGDEVGDVVPVEHYRQGARVEADKGEDGQLVEAVQAFRTEARARFSNRLSGPVIDAGPLARPGTFGGTLKLDSRESDDNTTALVLLGQEQMLKLVKAKELLIFIRVFPSAEDAGEFALGRAFAGSAPTPFLLERARKYFRQKDTPGDLCFGPDLFVRDNVTVWFGCDDGNQALAVSKYVDKCLRELGEDNRLEEAELPDVPDWDPEPPAPAALPSATLRSSLKDPAKLKALLEKDPSMAKFRFPAGWAPLHSASSDGDKAVVELLLQYGADVNAKNDNGRYALHYAARGGHHEVAELLMVRDSLVDVADENGQTPLHVAVERGIAGYDVALLLLKSKAKVNAKDMWKRTPLHYARRAKVASLLLREGAKVDARDEVGRTPLHSRRSPEVLQLLFKHGAEVDAGDNKGRTPLHHAASGAAGEAVILFLLKNGAAIEARDKTGMTPLHCAAAAGRLESVNLLLRQGCAVNPKDKDGKTPLDHAKRVFSKTRRGAQWQVQPVLDRLRKARAISTADEEYDPALVPIQLEADK